MAQWQLSDYYYELDTKIKSQYLEKISLTKQEDPNVLETAEFCYVSFAFSWVHVYVHQCSVTYAALDI